MNKTLRASTKQLLLAMLILSALCFASCVHRPPQIVVIPGDKMIKQLPNGNYEVTPAWLLERYELERWLKKELEECRQK